MCGITSLSHHARRVYYFDSLYRDWGEGNLEIVRVFDADGVYRKKVLSNWKNTTEQCELMLQYPLCYIAL
jgi:hypothetical protein